MSTAPTPDNRPSPSELLELLTRAFPASTHDAKQGKTYVPGHFYVHRLVNDIVFWDFRILSEERYPIKLRRKLPNSNQTELVEIECRTVRCELTIPGLGTRAGTGVQLMEDNAGEDVLKGAETDALKRCCMLFGMGLELYFDKKHPMPARTQTPAATGSGAPPRAQPARVATPKEIQDSPNPLMPDPPGESLPPDDAAAAITPQQSRAIQDLWRRLRKTPPNESVTPAIDEWLADNDLPPLDQLAADQAGDVLRVLQQKD